MPRKKLPPNAADHPDEDVRAEHFAQAYVEPDKPKWLDDDKRVVRLIQYLRDPAEKIRQVAFAVLVEAWVMHELYPFRHQAEARAEAMVIAKDETVPFAMRLASICLLAHLDSKAAVPLIASALADVDHLDDGHSDFASKLDWMFTAADRIPHKSYVPGLERISKSDVAWLDTVEIRKLISRCRRAKNL